MQDSSALKALGIGLGIVVLLWIGLSFTTKQSSSQPQSAFDQLGQQQQQPQQNQLEGELTMPTIKTLADFQPIEGSVVSLQTSKGEIQIELYREQTPVTTLNFLTLVKDGFYDGVLFHRVIEDFMAQAGDPQTKDPAAEAAWGTGGPGYTIPDEFDPTLTHDGPGILSMANTGQPSTGGSQFFLTFAPTPWLDGQHTVFGRIIEGLEVLSAIEQGDVIQQATILR